MVVYFIMNQQGTNDSWKGVDTTKIVLFEKIHDIPFYNLNIVLIDDFYDPENPKFVMNTLKNKIDNNIKNQYPHYYIEFNEQQVLDECNKYFVSNKNGVTEVLDTPVINGTIETKTCSIEYYKKLWEGKEQSCTIKNEKGEDVVKHLTNESKIFDQAFEPVTKNNESAQTLFIHSVENTDDKNSANSPDSFSNNNNVSTILKFISGHVKKADYNNMKMFNYTDEEIIVKSMLIEFLEETPIIFNILYYLYKTTTNENVYTLLSNLATCYTNKNEIEQKGNTNPYKVICKFDYNPTIKKDSEDKDKCDTISKLIDDIYSYLTKNNEYKYKICRVKQHCLYNDYITLKINDIVNAIISSCITNVENDINKCASNVKENMKKDDICKGMKISEKCKDYVLNANNTVDNYKSYCYSMFVLAKTRFKINSKGNGEIVGIDSSTESIDAYDSNSPYYNIAEKLDSWSPNIELSCVRCKDFNNCKEEKICINNNNDKRENYSFNKPSAKRRNNHYDYNNDNFSDKRRDSRSYDNSDNYTYSRPYQRNFSRRGHGYGAYGDYSNTGCKNGRVCKYKTCNLKTIDNEDISVDIFHMASVNLFYGNYTFLQSEMKLDNSTATNTILIYDTLNKYYSNLYRCVENNKQ